MPHALPVARPSVVYTPLSDGALLASLDKDAYYALDTVGAMIWDLMSEDGLSFDALCGRIGQRFPHAAMEEIRADVASLFEDLSRHGFVDRERSDEAA